jgi:hypothetical protein
MYLIGGERKRGRIDRMKKELPIDGFYLIDCCAHCPHSTPVSFDPGYICHTSAKEPMIPLYHIWDNVFPEKCPLEYDKP